MLYVSVNYIIRIENWGWEEKEGKIECIVIRDNGEIR